MNLINQKILITGASSGLGLELAKQLVSLGAIVVGTCYNSQNIKQVQFEVNGFANGLTTDSNSNFKPHLQQKFKLIQADVSNYDQACVVVKTMIDELGGIDILINNAGVYMEGELQNNDVAKIINAVNTNLLGTILTTKAVLPSMLEQNKGLIFCVASNCGIYNKKERSVYGATKWGIRGFVDNLKLDLATTKIKAFGFYPAGIATDLFVNAGLGTDTQKMMKSTDVAQLIIQILTDSDKYIMDHIVVDKPSF